MNEEDYGMITLDVLGISWLRSMRGSENSVRKLVRSRILEISEYGSEENGKLRSYIIGDFGKLLLEDGIDVDAYLKGREIEKQQTMLGSYFVEVPEEYRRYIKKSEIHKLPKGTRIYRGPRGGLYVDVREIGEEKLQEYGLKHYRRESESVEEHRHDILRDIDTYEKMIRKAGRDVKEYASIFSYLHESLSDMPEIGEMENLFRGIETGIDHLFDPSTPYEDIPAMVEKIKSGINAYSDLLVSLGEKLGKDEYDFLRRYARFLLVLRGYASTNYDLWSCILEAVDKRMTGNRRFGFIDSVTSKLGDDKRAELISKIAEEISDEEYELWREYCKEMFRKYVLKGKKRVKIYRGLSEMEKMNVIANLMLGRGAKINGVIASFTVSREVAEKFGDFIAWVYEDGNRVIGGWWNASEFFDTKEKEVTLVVDSGGMKLSGVDVSMELRDTIDMVMTEGNVLEGLDAMEKMRRIYRVSGRLFGMFVDMIEYYLKYGRKLKEKTKIYDKDYSAIFDKMANTVRNMFEEMGILVKRKWSSENKWMADRYIGGTLEILKENVEAFSKESYIGMVEELPDNIRESVRRFEELMKHYAEKLSREAGEI